MPSETIPPDLWFSIIHPSFTGLWIHAEKAIHSILRIKIEISFKKRTEWVIWRENELYKMRDKLDKIAQDSVLKNCLK